jgi:hypothetical protein
MKLITCLSALLIVTGCANSPSSKPSVLYAAPISIGVRYYSGDPTTDVEQSKEAMEIIDEHCFVDYVVTSKKEKDGWTTIDAQCK